MALNLTVEDLLAGVPGTSLQQGDSVSPIDAALAAEGVTGRAADFVRSVYQQESGSGKNTKTSSAGAVGPMQVIPSTFRSVADKDWSIANPEHNLRAGIRYAKQGFDAAGGDPALAGAYYYGGPGGMEKAARGVAVSDPRNPRAPNTLQYGQQVAARMDGSVQAGNGAATPVKSSEYYSPDWSNYNAPEKPKATGLAGLVDDLKTGFSRGFTQSQGLAGGAAALISNTLNGGEETDFQRSAMAYYDEKMKEAQTLSGDSTSFTDVLDGKGSFPKWMADSAGYLGYQITEAVLTGGAGGFIGKQIGKKAVTAVAEEAVKKEIAKIAATDAAKTMTAAQVANVAAGNAARNMAAGTSVFLNNIRQEGGSIYGDALEQAKKTGKPADLTKIWAATVLAAGVDTAADVAAAKGVLGMGGGSSAATYVGRAAREIPKGMAVQGGTEYTQTGIEYWGADKDFFTPEGQKEGIDSAAVGAFGGTVGGAGSALHKSAPAIAPELQPVANTAAEPNSPLSRAAVAGVTATEQLQQNTVQPDPDPTARLNELRAKVSGGQNLTAQELTEYDDLNDVADRNARLRTPEDPIAKRVAEIEEEVRQGGVLQTLRSIGQQGITEKEFLEALAVARNPELDKKSPLIRQRALESLESAMSWAQQGKMPGLTQERGLAPIPGVADLSGSAPGNRLGMDGRTIDVDATRVDNMLPGPRALPGHDPYISHSEQTTAQQPAAQPTPQPARQEVAAQPQAPITSPAVQQTVEQATEGLPRVEIPPMAPGELPSATNTAQRRKRKAQLRQLADIGFRTTTKTDGGFILRNDRTGQEVVLESMAESQLARAAIHESLAAETAKSPNSPHNDLKESSDAQNKAGNYFKPEVELNGQTIKVEQDKGSIRSGTDKSGKKWSQEMKSRYGYIKNTKAADGYGVDVLIGDRPDSPKIFVIDQVNKDGSFDEPKVVMGVTDEDHARKTYLSNYEPGWTGLGAITEMSQQEFDAWAHSDAPTRPVMLDKVKKLFTVTDKGVPVTLMSLDTSEVGDASAPRTGKGKFISKKDADLVKAVASVFGVKVQFFRPVTPGFNADGFFNGGNTLHLNERTTISPLAVFGHEFMHRIKATNPKAYDSIAKVVAANVKDPQGYRADYFGKEYAEQHGNKPLTSAELEELVSDLHGNLMTDSKFWGDVFRQIAKDHGAEAKGIIAKLSAFLGKTIDALVNSLKSQHFNAGQFVNNMKDVRAAFRDGLAQYLNDSGVTKTAMQAEILRAEQKTKGDDIKRSTPKPDDGLTVEGYHFSKAPREILSTGMFGTGLQGSARDEIMAHPDKRLRERLSFYVDKGTGIHPEAGVGGYAHKAELTNLYDADTDKLRLKSGDARAFESKVLDAGYSGYLNRLDGTQSGHAILLGAQTIKPEVLGSRTTIDGAKAVSAPAAREMDLGDKIMANRDLPGGSLSPSRWVDILTRMMPAEAAQLLDVGALGNESLYKDELVAKIRKLQPEIKKSAERAQQEYAEVEAKYKGTDAWMKAPNGNPTNLTERQWVQVRTPSFQKWFGPWEDAAKGDGVWARDDVSKVVDEAGEPMVVYHGSDKGGFMEFRKPSGSKRGDLGIFTTSNVEMADSYVHKGRASRVVDPEVGEQTGWQYISNKTGDVKFVMQLGDDADTRAQREKANDATAKPIYGKLPVEGQQRGVYALFMNLRNPQEDDFEGANWSGERTNQWVLMNDDGDQIYSDDGKAYFTEEQLDEQLRILDEKDISAKAERAPDHYTDTDGAVRDAIRSKADGAIVREVMDDGGGNSRYAGEPSDIFVAFDPGSVKSADFNNGEFSDSTGDIRKSTIRSGRAEEVGEYTIRVQKDGSIVVPGDADAIRAAMPPSVVGRVIKGGMAFSPSDAPRVRLALEGSKTAYSRAGRVIDKLPMRNGAYVGAPEKYNKPGNIGRLRKILMDLATEGAPGRFWYERSSEEVLRMTGGDVQEARKFVALLAIYSPQAKVDANSTFALRAWAQYKAGQPISVKTGVMDAKAQAAMDDVDAFWSGEKTGNFFFNLLRMIDLSTEGKQGATIDMWMMRAGQYGNDAPTATQYAFMENETNRVAAELGWEPQQVQAAIWVAMKARMENSGVKQRTEASSEKRGWIRFVKKIDPETGKSKQVRDVINQQKHRDNWLREAFALDVGADDTAQAKFDFADGILRHIGQISWEPRPSTKLPILPGIHSAPYAQQVEFWQAIQKVLYNEDGADLLAQKLGLLVDSVVQAPGIWEGDVSAGGQSRVAMAPAKGGDGKTQIDVAQKQLLDVYAAVLGFLLRQDGVGYHRPFYASNKSDQNGVELRIGRPFTDTEAKALWKAIDGLMRESGKTDWEQAAGIISSPEGMRVVNFGAIDDNKSFRGLVETAAEALPGDVEVVPGYFASDGNLVGNSWKDEPNGQGYARAIAASGRQDILEWAADVLAPKIQRVFEDFSDRYNWGDPGQIPAVKREERRVEVSSSTPRNEEVSPAAKPVSKDEISPEEARGRTVTQEVEIEDTGKTGKLSVDAERTLADYNQRIESMKKLLGCLKK